MLAHERRKEEARVMERSAPVSSVSALSKKTDVIVTLMDFTQP